MYVSRPEAVARLIQQAAAQPAERVTASTVEHA